MHGSQNCSDYSTVRSDVDGDARPKPLFEHVWQVNVKTKGLGSSRNITGPHRLCLTASALTLVKMHTDQENPEALEFPLMSIRRCGHSDCFFFMELGRSSVTGSGELWMQTEDTVIAQNMHETILGAMKTSRNKEELGAFTRPRSSSTSENSKPIAHKRPAHAVATTTTHASTSCRDRCDSMPTSRTRNSSESHGESSGLSRTHTAEATARPHSSYGRTYSVSPPSNNPITVGSFDSTSSVLSAADETDGQAEYFNRYSHSLPMDIMAGPKEPTIKEEAAVDEYLMMSSPVGSSKSSHYSRPTTFAGNLGGHQPMNMSESSDYLKMSMSPASNVPEGNGKYYSSKSCIASQVLPALLPFVTLGDGYIPMSPVGSMSLSSSLEKTAAPSSSADTGYLSMEPQGAMSTSGCTTVRPVGHASCSSPTVVHAGFPSTILPVPLSEYMDMAPLSSSLPKSVGESCTDFSGSWCSAHSLQDVPSSASPLSASLEGFHLDKVKSYFSPSEDDAEAFIKPVRAYSIGSRQQVKKTSLAGHLDQSRVRAYSVGSQVAPTAMRRRLKKDADVDANALQRLEGQKSSSVPTLQEDASSSQQAPRALNYNEDLMEINYDRSDLGQGSSSTPVVEKSSVLPPASMKQPETSEAIRKLSTASTPSTTKTFDDYMVMTTGSESGAGSSSSYQHSLTSPTGSEHTERKVSVPSSSRQRKEDLGKENHPGGRSSSYTGMVRRSSTTQQALREDNAVSMSSSLPSNGLNQCKTDSEYVATEMTKKGVAFLGTSNGTVSKGKPGSSYHVLPMTTTSLRPASPESQQLGEYVNLDLSKTMKWTQHVKMPVSSSGDSTPTTSSANGSSFWSSGPKLPAEGSTSVTRVAPLAVAESSYVQLRGLADPPPAATVLQQVPPEANYENISLKGGAATVVEAPAERVLNYASLDLAPPSGEDGAPSAVQRSPRAPNAAGIDAATEEGPTFSYAEIDFTKSEGLRNVSGYRS
ncbi:hypothetical protein MRX96_045413 [Rhipicephalus microplus]